MGKEKRGGSAGDGIQGGFEDLSVSSVLTSHSALVTNNRLRGLQHSATPQEIDDVEAYLKERIPDIGDKPSKA